LTVYLDSSALFKRYVREIGTTTLSKLLDDDDRWVAANHVFTEVQINLKRRLVDVDLGPASALFEEDWSRILIIGLDDRLCRRAASIGAERGVRTLDAMHLAAAERAGGAELTFVTFDSRLAAAARSMGFPVAGI